MPFVWLRARSICSVLIDTGGHVICQRKGHPRVLRGAEWRAASGILLKRAMTLLVRLQDGQDLFQQPHRKKKKRHSLARWNSAVGVGSHGCSYARLSFQQFNCTPSIHNWECWFIAPPKSTGIFTSRQVISHNNEKGYTLHSKEVFHWDITMLSRGNLI